MITSANNRRFHLNTNTKLHPGVIAFFHSIKKPHQHRLLKRKSLPKFDLKLLRRVNAKRLLRPEHPIFHWKKLA